MCDCVVVLIPHSPVKSYEDLVYLVCSREASSSANEALASSSISSSMEPVVDLDIRATSLVESAKISSASHALVSTLTAESMIVPAALNTFMVFLL